MVNLSLFQNPVVVLLVFLVLFIAVIFLIFKLARRSQLEVFSGTPILNSFSKDVTELAGKDLLDPVIGRKKEIEHLIMILTRRTKNNVVLVGKAGVGKTAIVEGLAHNIAEGNVPQDLKGKRVLAFDLNSLIAGTKYRGEFEERIKKITEEISSSKRNIILFIDEIQNLIEAESSGESISVGDIFKPAMARGELQIIGATTPGDYEQYFKKDPAFKRRLQPIFVEEPSEEETLKILQGIKGKYEAYHGVKISDEALSVCIEQSKKIMPERSFPDKAIDLMDESASKVRIESVKREPGSAVPEVKASDVVEMVNEYEKNSEIYATRELL